MSPVMIKLQLWPAVNVVSVVVVVVAVVVVNVVDNQGSKIDTQTPKTNFKQSDFLVARHVMRNSQ